MADNKNTVLLYDGEGSSEQSVRQAFHTFTKLLVNSKYKLQKISPDLILKDGWQKSTALLIMGGGYDLGYINALKSNGMAMIRKYVEDGGSYLGICAGGYFACNFIEFDKDGPLEVCGKRELNFYPGGCIGPVYPGFAYETKKGAYAVPVSWDTSNIVHSVEEKGNILDTHCYFNGGGYFTVPDSLSFNGEILGRYCDKDDKAIAIVKNQVGKGTVVLSGVHFEYEPSLLDGEDTYLKKRNVIPTLNKTLNRTCLLNRSILRHLHILVK